MKITKKPIFFLAIRPKTLEFKISFDDVYEEGYILLSEHKTCAEAGAMVDKIVAKNMAFQEFCSKKLTSPDFELGEDTWGTVPENGYLKEQK